MEELNREVGTTLVLVTHDPTWPRARGAIIRLRDGGVGRGPAAA